MQLIKVPNPFQVSKKEVTELAWAGQTIEQIIRSALQQADVKIQYEDASQFFTISVNGLIIPKSSWDTYRPAPKDCIVITPVIGKGQNEKMVLGIVLMIVTFGIAGPAAFAMGGAAAGATTYAGLSSLSTLGMVYATGIMVAGGMLISGMSPKPKQRTPDFDSSELSQTFGWEPTTMQRQGMAVPRFYGRNKLYGNVIAAWSEVTGESTNVQRLYSLFGLCMGPIRGVVEYPDSNFLTTGTIALYGYCSLNVEIDDVVVTDLADDSTLLDDDFDDGNTTGWTLVNDCGAGSPTFVNPSTFGRMNTDGYPYLVGLDELEQKGVFAKWDSGTSWTNYRFSCKIKCGDNLLDPFGVMFRYTDQNNYYRFSIDGRHNQAKLVRVKNGEFSLLWSETYTDDTYNVWRDLIIECDESEITITYNGIEMLTYTDDDAEIEINNQPMSNFPNLAYRAKNGLLSQEVLEWFDGVKHELVPNYHVSSLKPKVYQVPDNDFDTFEIDIAFHNGLYYATASLNNYTVEIKIEIKKATENDEQYLTITKSDESITDSTSSKVIRTYKTVRRKITSITKANPGVVTIDEPHGFSDGDSITFNGIAGMTELENQTHVITVLSDTTFSIGDTSGYGTAGTGGIAHKQLSDVIERGNKYDIRVTKVTADKNDSAYGDKMYLDRVREVYSESFTYPRTALVGINAVATDTLSGSIGFSCIADCLLVRVYDSSTQTWSVKYSTNPAWVIFDLMTQPVYSGSGTDADPFVVERYDGINPSRLSSLLDKLVELSEFCGREVTNNDTINITHISQATNAVVTVASEHGLLVGDEVRLNNVDESGMTEIADNTLAEVTAVNSMTEFEIDIDTSAYSNYWKYTWPVQLLLHGEGNDGSQSIIDSSDTEHTVSVDGKDTQIDTAQYKYGSASILFDGVDDYLKVGSAGHSDFDFAAGDFTVDFWVRWNTLPASGYHDFIVNKWAVNKRGWGVSIEEVSGSYRITFSWSNNGTTHTTSVSSSSFSLSAGTWYHIAVVRDGNTIRFFLDGVAKSTGACSDTIYNSSDVLWIGCHAGNPTPPAGYYLDGWLDEVRALKGTAEWTSGFTPPTAAYAKDQAGTVAKKKCFIEFNGGFDETTTLWEAILEVCKIARCNLVPEGTGYTLTIDKSDTPSQMFTVGNIKEGSFKEIFLPEAERASEIEVHYRDAKQDYNRVPFTIFNENITNATNKVTLDLFGITDAEMAENAGDFELLKNQLLKRTFEYEVGIDAIACMAGDVVKLQHDAPNFGEMAKYNIPTDAQSKYGSGGRIVSATSTTIVIDRDVCFVPDLGGDTIYEISVRMNNDTIETKTISAYDAATNTITVSSAFTRVPDQYAPWAIGKQNLVTKSARVIGFELKPDLNAKILAIEYNEGIYANDPA